MKTVQAPNFAFKMSLQTFIPQEIPLTVLTDDFELSTALVSTKRTVIYSDKLKPELVPHAALYKLSAMFFHFPIRSSTLVVDMSLLTGNALLAKKIDSLFKTSPIGSVFVFVSDNPTQIAEFTVPLMNRTVYEVITNDTLYVFAGVKVK